ncbi:MAG TPA: ATP-binding protein [Solirubrobacterales bacterium]|nr:ATP-binding protein [Solirubrobacterales bacterium]
MASPSSTFALNGDGGQRRGLVSLEIDSFKAYEDETVSLSPLTIVIGRNGAGKTSLLQAVEFLGALVRGTLGEHLEHRGWDYADLPHLRNDHKQFGFVAKVLINGELLEWELRLGARRRSGVARERIVSSDGQLLLDRQGRIMRRLDRRTNEWESVTQTLTSSWLATVGREDADRFPELLSLADWARGILGYLALDPSRLREPSRKTSQLGAHGEGLAGLLRTLKDAKDGSFERVFKAVRQRYPALREINVRQGSYGWNRIEIGERWGREVVTLNARQVSDGLLRLLAVATLAEVPTPPSIVMIDEVENGVHPHLLDGLMGLLQDLTRSGIQVLATSHSPVALNYVESARQVLLARRIARGPARLTVVADTRGFEELGEHFDVGELWYNLGEQRLLRPKR